MREIEETRSVLVVGGDQYGSGLMHAGAPELETLPGEDEHAGLKIGMAYNHGHVVLVLEGPQVGAVVYPSEDEEGPLVLAPDLTAFFARLADQAMSIERLIP